MSRESLQVNTAHLRELAAKHGQAAAEISSATDAVSGMDNGIRTSHGVIAWATVGAVEAIQLARRAAGMSVAADSRRLSNHLTGAAGRYETVDDASGACLDTQIRPCSPDSVSPPERLTR